MIKRIIVFLMIHVLVLTFCSCGKKAKTNDKSSGDKSDESSVILAEDTIDGSVDIDVDDIPELEDDTDSNATDNTSSLSGSDNSSEDSTSSKTTSEDKKSDNKSSSSSLSADATEKNDDAVDKDSMKGWDPLT